MPLETLHDRSRTIIIRELTLGNCHALFKRGLGGFHLMRTCATALGILFLFAAQDVSAETVSKRVPANRATTLDLFKQWNNSCKNLGTISTSMTKRPSSGSLRPSVVSAPIPRRADIGSSACAGKKIKALRVVYQPKKGFRGRDSATISVNYGSSGRKSYTYSITVY
jgi:hypothetical protein